MNGRDIQLGADQCDQDQLLLNLIGGSAVRIIGYDQGFSKFCTVDDHSDFLIIFFNQPLWLSELRNRCEKYITPGITRVYLGINRYRIKGNDTADYCVAVDQDHKGKQILDFVSSCLLKKNFVVKQQGYLDNDQGRFFNFVQPLTWIYAEYEANTDQR